MNVGILETGHPPGNLAERYGDYPAMFERLLGPHFTTTTYDVASGKLPARPNAHGAYIVTGSPAGVYDELPWIGPLKAFLREARGEAKLVGVCFGHQIMAEAFDGRVAKSEKGWGVGLQTYDVTGYASWMDEPPQRISIPVSHQDQVVAQPPCTTILAASDFTPFGVLAWEGHPAVSMQFHPEFEPDYAKALIALRRDSLPDADAALASLDAPDDRERVAGWIRRFLKETGA